MTLVLTGLDLAAKARVAEEAIWARIPKDSFDEVDVTLTDSGLLRITVMDTDRNLAGRAFSAAVVETGLASYPGFYSLTPPGAASPYGVYWPVLVPASEVRPQVFLDGEPVPQKFAPEGEPLPQALDEAPVPQEILPDGEPVPKKVPDGEPVLLAVREGEPPLPSDGRLVRVPLGRIAGARSGDKGGNANLGVWTTTPEQYAWLAGHLTTERLKDLLPALAPHRVDRYELPDLKALNFVVHGLLGRGVAASPRMDPQAKALGEELRARQVDLPESLLPRGQP
jgi:hypothetical protein